MKDIIEQLLEAEKQGATPLITLEGYRWLAGDYVRTRGQEETA